jgi:hypothetical protein
MNTELNALDRIYVSTRILLGQPALAEFNYEDARGNTSVRRVSVDSVRADHNGNFVWYNYSNGDGHGGGHRAFNARRISNFRFVRR